MFNHHRATDMNLDIIRIIGLTERDFNLIGALLKEDNLTLEEFAIKINRPISTALCVATAVANEMAGSSIEETAPNLYISATPFIDERKERIENFVSRQRILKDLRSISADLDQLEMERYQSTIHTRVG